jgi:hypothetical protein
MNIWGWTMLPNAGSSVRGFRVALLALAGCGSSGQSSVGQDTAVAAGEVAMLAETEPTPQTAPTLETGLDLAAFAAAVTPQATQWITVIQPGAVADTIQVGRPWGQFDVHQGPRLVFRGSWRVLVASGGDYVAVAGVVRDGDSYKMISIGSTQFVPTMVEREQMPAVSAALDRGRAGFLRRVTDGGDAFAAYEAEAVADAGQPEIRVQSLGLQVIDGGVFGVVEMSLDELDLLLPAE